MSLNDNIHHPDIAPRRELAAIFMVAVMLRVLVFVVASTAFQIPIQRYANKGDGESYQRYALAFLREPTELTSYDTRVLPGFPLLIAGLHLLRIPVAIAGLLIDFLGAGTAAALAAQLFNDRRIGWAMVMLIPHYVINSSLVMSESPMLATTLAGLWLATRGRVVAGGLLLGFAVTIRPAAGFAALGYTLWAWRREEWKSLALCATAASCVVISTLIGLHHWFGDPLHWAHTYASETGAYNGRILTFPLESLIDTPLHNPAALRRAPYIGLHVLFTLCCCVLLIAEYRKTRDPLAALALPWLLVNTAFVLCIGSHWGFDHFPRFTVPAQPAMFYAARRYLPRPRWPWTIVGAAVFIISIYGVRASP